MENLWGPMALKVRQAFPPRLALVHGWLFPAKRRNNENNDNDEDNSDSYKQGAECWISGNSRKPRR